MHISSQFDSGNIEVVEVTADGARLRLRPDPTTQTPDGPVRFAQWFHFRVTGVAGQPLVLRVEDAWKAAYPGGWPDYRAVVSEDQQRWVRCDSAYDGRDLTLRYTPTSDVVWFAYFAPYPLSRVAEVIARAAQHAAVRVSCLGLTLDGRTIDRLTVGDPARDLPVIWVLARQHPGESMASWWMEGFLDRLLDPDDALAGWLRDRATLQVVPQMNPDGSFRGHLRTNAAGANLNREWLEPSLTTSPEVHAVRAAMDATGVDACLDVHGDEALPYTFVSGAEGSASWGPRTADLQQRFLDAYERANPDFQQVHGYPIDRPGGGNPTMCTNAVADRYQALAMTLEMPFKDNADRPDPVAGWSPARCLRMGASAVDALAAVVERLRT